VIERNHPAFEPSQSDAFGSKGHGQKQQRLILNDMSVLPPEVDCGDCIGMSVSCQR
jgi:hypothetical protein